MKKLIISFVIATMLVAPAVAKDTTCRDAKGQFMKKVDCPKPAAATAAPKGATAMCKDNTYSMSKTRSGTCSKHGGVAKWL